MRATLTTETSERMPTPEPFRAREASGGILVEATGLSPAEREALFDHLGALRALSAPGILAPSRVEIESETVTARYDGPWEPPGAVDAAELRELADALFAAHNRRLYHGAIAPDSVVRVGGRLALAGFGWGPLLDSRTPPSTAFTAPEHRTGGATAAGDQYGFGRLSALLLPELAGTPWHGTCTAADPKARYPRMREAKRSLPNPGAPDRPVGLVPLGELRETEPGAPIASRPPGASAPRPIVRITATVEPSQGGRIEGPREAVRGDYLTLRFLPNPGYRIVRWSLTGKGGPEMRLRADSDLSVVVYASPHRRAKPWPAVLAVMAILAVWLRSPLRASRPAERPPTSRSPSGPSLVTHDAGPPAPPRPSPIVDAERRGRAAAAAAKRLSEADFASKDFEVARAPILRGLEDAGSEIVRISPSAPTSSESSRLAGLGHYLLGKAALLRLNHACAPALDSGRPLNAQERERAEPIVARAAGELDSYAAQTPVPLLKGPLLEEIALYVGIMENLGFGRSPSVVRLRTTLAVKRRKAKA